MPIQLNSTTLSNAITATQSSFVLASVTNVATGNYLYVIDPARTEGELMGPVTAVNTSTGSVTVQRNGAVPRQNAHSAGAYVVIGPSARAFPLSNPPLGPVTAASEAANYTPWINAMTGEQWLFSTGSLSYVPGFNNPTSMRGQMPVLASAAGANLPPGPLFHVSGTAAVVTWTLPAGFSGGSFTVIPDGVFTWTSAGNIAIAGTAVVNRALTFFWDNVAGKFYPSYI